MPTCLKCSNIVPSFEIVDGVCKRCREGGGITIKEASELAKLAKFPEENNINKSSNIGPYWLMGLGFLTILIANIAMPSATDLFWGKSGESALRFWQVVMLGGSGMFGYGSVSLIVSAINAKQTQTPNTIQNPSSQTPNTIQNNSIEDLEKLSGMLEKGIINKEEFDALKAKLLQ
jgi:hypothetical protein